MPLPKGATSGSRQRAEMSTQAGFCWGKKWGKKPHRLQPIPVDLDLAKTA
jgi:hypothetical protein